MNVSLNGLLGFVDELLDDKLLQSYEDDDDVVDQLLSSEVGL